MTKQTVENHISIEENKKDSLSVSDRCDRCGAQAYVKILGVTGELLFCSHHYNKIINNPESYTKMMSFMYAILDERDKLEENRLVGGHNQ